MALLLRFVKAFRMDIRVFLTLSATLLATVSSYNKDVLNMYVRKYKGEGTYYGRGTFGTCDYGPILPPAATHPRIRYLVGLGAKQFAGGVACGMCLRVFARGEGLGKDPIVGDFVVFVNDLCSDCEEGDMDFAEEGDGRWKIEMRAVQCPVGETKINYKMQGSNPWYVKLQVRNARLPVDMVHVLSDGMMERMNHTADGFWELASGIFTLPIHIRLTSITGETIQDLVPKIENDVVIEGESQAQFENDPRILQA